MAERREFVVVGGGLLGLSTAVALGRLGRDVVCLERATVGNEKAGSKGNARIFRFTYDDPLYVRMAMRAFPGWARLAEEAGRKVLFQTGLLSFGDRVYELSQAMRAAGAAASVLEADEIASRWPDLRANGRALFEETAGVLRADAVLAALAALLQDGQLVENALVTAIDDSEGAVTVTSTAGDYDCQAAIICAGAWTGKLATAAGLPGAGALFTSGQQVAFLRPAKERPAALVTPAFVERGAVTYFGLAVPGESLYKVGIHDYGSPVDPEADALADDPSDVAFLSAMATRLLPGWHPQPVATERCYYDNTPDADFVIDRVGRVVIGGGSSGHGFKFGPVWGEVLADLAMGRIPSVPLERFSLRRLRP
jgi:sarcosine oxidase